MKLRGYDAKKQILEEVLASRRATAPRHRRETPRRRRRRRDLAGPGRSRARAAGAPNPTIGRKGGCQRCKFEATLPCPKHPKNAAKQEEGAIFCSVAAACPLCEGIFRVDCPDCHGAGQTELEAKRAEVERLIEKEKAFEKEMGVTRARARSPSIWS